MAPTHSCGQCSVAQLTKLPNCDSLLCFLFLPCLQARKSVCASCSYLKPAWKHHFFLYLLFLPLVDPEIWFVFPVLASHLDLETHVLLKIDCCVPCSCHACRPGNMFVLSVLTWFFDPGTLIDLMSPVLTTCGPGNLFAFPVLASLGPGETSSTPLLWSEGWGFYLYCSVWWEMYPFIFGWDPWNPPCLRTGGWIALPMIACLFLLFYFFLWIRLPWILVYASAYDIKGMVG